MSATISGLSSLKICFATYGYTPCNRTHSVDGHVSPDVNRERKRLGEEALVGNGGGGHGGGGIGKPRKVLREPSLAIG